MVFVADAFGAFQDNLFFSSSSFSFWKESSTAVFLPARVLSLVALFFFRRGVKILRPPFGHFSARRMVNGEDVSSFFSFAVGEDEGTEQKHFLVAKGEREKKPKPTAQAPARKRKTLLPRPFGRLFVECSFSFGAFVIVVVVVVVVFGGGGGVPFLFRPSFFTPFSPSYF